MVRMHRNVSEQIVERKYFLLTSILMITSIPSAKVQYYKQFILDMRTGGSKDKLPRTVFFAAWEVCSKFSRWPRKPTNWESLADHNRDLLARGCMYFWVGAVKASNLRQDFVSRKRKFWSRDRRSRARMLCRTGKKRENMTLHRTFGFGGYTNTKIIIVLFLVQRKNPPRAYGSRDAPWSRKGSWSIWRIFGLSKRRQSQSRQTRRIFLGGCQSGETAKTVKVAKV